MGVEGKLDILQEDLTGYMGTIDSDHAYIHKGLAFTYHKIVTLAGSAINYIMLKTPAASIGKTIHFRPILLGSSESPVVLALLETPTYTGGDDDTGSIWNRNRSLKDTHLTTVTIKNNISTFSGGTVLENYYIGSGTNPAKASGGSNGAEHEIMLLPDTEYCLRQANQTSTQTKMTIALFWYEEESMVVA